MLGGLLSTHLFAVGDLPIRGYQPPEKEATFAKAWDKSSFPKGSHGIKWKDGFIYDGQFLRLAVDLADRILPAFYTDTGLPYPRVNLRYGVQRHPYYAKSPLNVGLCDDPNHEFCGGTSQSYQETTETCSAGAGSLVLEFSVLSRLTGDGRYEDLGKTAFWAVWARRSDIGLIGSGIDVETGRWMQPYTGVCDSNPLRSSDGKLTLRCRLEPALIASSNMHSSPISFCLLENVRLIISRVRGVYWTTASRH